MTNQELAAALRLCASVYRCDECPYLKPGEPMTCIFTIKRQAATALENHETHIAALQREIEGLRKRLELAQKPQWVSVEERLPEENRRVILYIPKVTERGNVRIGWLEPIKMWYTDNQDRLRYKQVTHWMPLPEFREEVE